MKKKKEKKVQHQGNPSILDRHACGVERSGFGVSGFSLRSEGLVLTDLG